MGKPRRGDARQAPAAAAHGQAERGDFLQSVAEKARLLTGGQASALCMFTEPGGRIRVVAASGQFADRTGDEASAGEGMARHLLLSSFPMLCTTCDEACCPFIPPASRHHHLIAPVRVGGRVRAVLCSISAASVSMPSNPAPVMTRLAEMAASCLSLKRGWDLAEELGAMIARQRAAADIHDGPAQNLIRLHMLLDDVLSRSPGIASSLPELVTARELVTGTIEDLRAMIASLRDPGDHSCSPQEVADILLDAAGNAAIPGGIVSVHGEPDCRVPATTGIQVRQIVAEAVTNAGRHADATAISVRFSRERDEGVVHVTDNGHGIAEDLPRTGGSHVGTEIMQLRAAVIGGTVEVTSAPDGTEVILRWPLLAV